MRQRILLSIALLFFHGFAHANLIVNGSFEDPFIGSAGFNTLGVGDTSITGWEVSATTIQHIGTLLWNASDGMNSIDLDGNAGDAGGIRQSFSTVAGQEYRLMFDLAGNPALGRPRVKDMRVSADGQFADFTFDTTNTDTINMGWTTIEWAFTADDAEATLEFLSLSTGPVTGWGAAIDNVSVSVVPIPMAALLFPCGLIAGIGWMRHQRA